MDDKEKVLYPQQIDEFRQNVNATGPDDSNEDAIVYAEDINKIQNAILALENTLGVNPQGEHSDVSQTLYSLGKNKAFSLPRIVLIMGIRSM
jgi:hypothetical protein